MAAVKVHLKPLNLLVITGERGQDISLNRNRLSENLLKNVHEDRYTVYDVTFSEFAENGWTESTIALVIPSPASGGPVKLSSKVLLHIRSFFLEGGKLLSFHPQVNTVFGFRLNSDLLCVSVNMVTFTYKTGFDPSTDTRDRTSAGDEVTCPLIPVESSVSKDNQIPLVGATRQMLITVPSVGTVVELLQAQSTGGGTAVLSYVDLSPDPLHYSNPNEYGRIVNTSDAREAVICSLLEYLQLHLSDKTALTYSLSYILESGKTSHMHALLPILREHVIFGSYTVEVIGRDEHGGVPVDCHPTDNKLCVLSNPSPGELSGIKFNREEYFKELHTKSMGQTVLYTPVIASTHLLYERNVPLLFVLGNRFGLVSVAGRQTKGKGRRGNIWLSPEGCLLFSTSHTFPKSSVLYSHIGVQQHLPVTAVVHGIRSMKGYEDLNIRIKWQNDVYFGCEAKIGGGLVDVHMNEHTVLITTGVGVNVTNDYPTLSLNDCINLHNVVHSANLKPISIEQLMARTLNVLEALIDDMEGVLVHGKMEDTLFMNLYYKYWLHSDIGREAVLQPGGEKVVIKGLDSDGQLVVTGEHGQGITLTARQYGFDIVKGIIVEKT